jgi:hypothetical protein
MKSGRMGQAKFAHIRHHGKGKKGFRIQRWVPHQKQKSHATGVVIAASTSALMRRHWFRARRAAS